MFEKLFLRSGLSFERLRTLLLVAESGGITLAAQGNPVTQSLFSRQLRELEEFFGLTLFERRGRGIVMTRAGERLVVVARECLFGLDGFLDDAMEDRTRFDIGAGDSLLQWILIPAISRAVLELAPFDLRLRNMRTKEIVQSLRDLELDVGLVRDEVVMPPLKSQRLFSMSYTLFVPEPLLSQRPKVDLPRLLSEIPLALLTDSGFEQAVVAEMKGKRAKTILGCDSFTQAAAALTTGRFGAVLPTVAAGTLPVREVRAIELKSLKKMARTIHLAWNPRLAGIRSKSDGFRQILYAAISKTETIQKVS